MEKVVELILKLLPVPILLLVGATFCFAWILKELRDLQRWRDVFRQQVFQVVLGVVVTGFVGYQTWMFLDRVSPSSPFSKSDIGIAIAKFDNDGTGYVQTHVFETLLTAAAKTDTQPAVEIARLQTQFKNSSHAKNICYRVRAKTCVWGTYIPPVLHVKVLNTLDGSNPGRQFYSNYLELEGFPSLVLDAARNTAAAQAQPGIQELQTNVLSLEAEVAGFREDLRNIRTAFREYTFQTAHSEIEVLKFEDFTRSEKSRTRLGLFVGVSEFQEFPALLASASDANDIAHQLSQIWPDSFDTTVLTNSDATRIKIQSQMADISSMVQTNDQVWVYLSGHAVLEGDVAYFIPYDGSTKSFRASAIPLQEIYDWLSNLSATQKILFIDTCYAGSVIDNYSKGIAEKIRGYERYSRATGTFVITATGQNELSYESAELGRGIFTHALLESLKPETDVNLDGVISGQELYVKTSSIVSEEAIRSGFSQRPVLWSTVSKGDIPLAITPTHQ